MTETVYYRFLTRGGTAAAVAALNEVPYARELIMETDTGRAKLGDGVTAYNDLPYLLGVLPGQIGFGASNEGAAITSGVKRVLRITDRTIIQGWTLSAEAPGNAEVQLWVSNSYPPTAGDAITGASAPKLVAAASNAGSTSGWTTAEIPAGRWLAFNVASGATVERLDLTLRTLRIP